VALDVLVQAIEKAKSVKAEDVTMALRGGKFTGGWTKAMTGGAVEFDSTGLNTASIPVMVQWRKKELVTVWPKDVAKGAAEWKS
jgi:branched-chain amino acid transport system substrate-binding protein